MPGDSENPEIKVGRKHPKDFWIGDDIYCDSCGRAWGVNEKLETVCMGPTENLGPRFRPQNMPSTHHKLAVAKIQTTDRSRGRPRLDIPETTLSENLSLRQKAEILGVSKDTIRRRMQ